MKKIPDCLALLFSRATLLRIHRTLDGNIKKILEAHISRLFGYTTINTVINYEEKRSETIIYYSHENSIDEATKEALNYTLNKTNAQQNQIITTTFIGKPYFTGHYHEHATHRKLS